jgi:hypothetical protein
MANADPCMARKYAVNATLPNETIDSEYLFAIRDRIQDIFEQELSANFWFLPIIRKAKALSEKLKK